MTWFFLALLSAVLASTAAIIEKRTLNKEHALEFAASLAIVNAILALPFFYWADFSRLDPFSLSLLFVVALCAAVAFYLISRALRHMEVSVASPLLVLGPGLTSILAFLLLGEELGRLQSFGIILMILGSYILETHSHGSIFDPIKFFWESRYAHFILIGLGLYSITSLLDRFVLAHYELDAFTYIAVIHLLIACIYIVWLFWRGEGYEKLMLNFRANRSWIVLASLLTIGYRFTDVLAVQIAFVGLVASVKRVSALFTTVIGGEIFHEKNLLRKFIACIIMLSGVALLAL